MSINAGLSVMAPSTSVFFLLRTSLSFVGFQELDRGRVSEVQDCVLSFYCTYGIGLTVRFKNRINRTWQINQIVRKRTERSRVSLESPDPSN